MSLSEDLLLTWLQLGTVIDNQRLVTGMSFNEAMVCGLLLRAQTAGTPATASELCAQTRILKSQMNAILRALEEKGYLARQRSQTDQRQVQLRLLPAGIACYQESHRRTLALVDRLIQRIGQEKTEILIPLLRQVAANFEMMEKER